MAKPGPKPKTKEALEAAGSWRVINAKDAPEFQEGVPGCPEWLDAEAKRCWKRTITQIKDVGIMRPAYREALAGMCYWWSRFRKLAETLNAIDGPAIVHMESKRLQTMVSESWTNYARFCAAFGLTPADRTRVVADAGSDKDKKTGAARFIKSA